MAHYGHDDPMIKAKKLATKFEAAFLDSDHTAISSLYSDDCKMITSADVVLTGASSVGNYMSDLFGAFDPQEASISVDDTQELAGGLLMLYGSYDFDMVVKGNGKAAKLEGKYTLVTRHDDGGLKIIQHTAFIPQPVVDPMASKRYADVASRYEKALENEDISSIVSLHTASAYMMGSNGMTMTGKTEIAKYFEVLLGQFEMKDVTISIGEVVPMGNGYYHSWGDYQFDVLPPSAPSTVPIKGKYTMVVIDTEEGMLVDKMVAMRPVSNPAASN